MPFNWKETIITNLNTIKSLRWDLTRGVAARSTSCCAFTKIITKISGGNVEPDANPSLRPAIIIGFDCNEEYLYQWETLFIEFLLAQGVSLQRYVPGTHFLVERVKSETKMKKKGRRSRLNHQAANVRYTDRVLWSRQKVCIFFVRFIKGMANYRLRGNIIGSLWQAPWPCLLLLVTEQEWRSLLRLAQHVKVVWSQQAVIKRQVPGGCGQFLNRLTGTGGLEICKTFFIVSLSATRLRHPANGVERNRQIRKDILSSHLAQRFAAINLNITWPSFGLCPCQLTLG